MANPVRYPFSGASRDPSGASRSGRRASCSILLITIALSGCSINLGSLTPASENEDTARPTSSVAASSSIAALTETIKNNPNDPQAYNTRGLALAQAGKLEDALADFNKAIGLEPNDARAYANRGLIYRQTKRLDQAMADYERALALDANDAPAYVGRGLVYKARKQPTVALADFNKALAIHTNNAEANYIRGLIY